jgi:ketosteroid isomerase-like protein
VRVSEIDSDRVLAVQTLSLRSRKGGVPLEQDMAVVMTVREGKIVRSESYRSVGQALEAARLQEQR